LLAKLARDSVIPSLALRVSKQKPVVSFGEGTVPPIITTTVEETRRAVAAVRAQGKSVGLVPSMGALHAGHASLIRTAREETEFVAVSIFVNPSQFGPKEDLTRYPRPFEHDVRVCADEGVDLVFHPTPEIMYPPSFQSWVEVHELQTVLCGASRPGHFRGVATVVLKLFNIVQPDVAYFGQKDAQQARVLLQMVRDLDLPVRLKICPIVREPDGLALSSRNAYLDADQRKQATVLHRALEAVRAQIEAGERRTDALIRCARALMEETPGARIDYVAIVAWETLQPLERVQGKVLIALAVYLGTTRLIDNMLMDIT
jgi:pantoate--beta-alanine ligase